MLGPRNKMQHVLQATPRDGSKRTELEGRCRCLQVLSTPSRLQTPNPFPIRIHPKIRNETMLGSTCLSAGNPCKASPVLRRVAREKDTGLIRPRRLRHTISGSEGQGYISTQNRIETIGYAMKDIQVFSETPRSNDPGVTSSVMKEIQANMAQR